MKRTYLSALAASLLVGPGIMGDAITLDAIRHGYMFRPYTDKNIGRNYVKDGRKTYQPNGAREVARRLRQADRIAMKQAARAEEAACLDA